MAGPPSQAAASEGSVGRALLWQPLEVSSCLPGAENKLSVCIALDGGPEGALLGALRAVLQGPGVLKHSMSSMHS